MLLSKKLSLEKIFPLSIEVQALFCPCFGGIACCMKSCDKRAASSD